MNFSDPFGLCVAENGDHDISVGDTTKKTKKTSRVSCEYAQSSGVLSCTDADGKSFSEKGYSGMGIFKDWPAMQSAKNRGPIPVGTYTIGAAMPGNYKGKGPVVMRLTPATGNNMFSRDGFLVHGDNATQTASEGCIIMSRNTREQMAAGGTLSSNPTHKSS